MPHASVKSDLHDAICQMIGVAGMLVQELVKPEAILDFLS